MHQHRSKIGSLVILAVLLVVFNPDLRALFVLVDALGIELVFLLIAIQLRRLPTLRLILTTANAWGCVRLVSIFRGILRAPAIVLPPRPATFGAFVYLTVLSNQLWCPSDRAG